MELRTNYVIRKSVKTFLIEVIIPVINIMIKSDGDEEKSQIDKVYDFVDLSKGERELSLSYFPLFNSNFLKSFPINRLRVSYRNGDKFVAMMNVIGYLDGFQGRMPNDTQKEWVDFFEKHKKECKVNVNTCAAVQYQTILYQTNLMHTQKMAESLLEEIGKVID